MTDAAAVPGRVVLACVVSAAGVVAAGYEAFTNGLTFWLLAIGLGTFAVGLLGYREARRPAPSPDVPANDDGTYGRRA